MVKIHKIEGRAVKVAIEAPKEINIVRAELLDRSIEKTKQAVVDEKIRELLRMGKIKVSSSVKKKETQTDRL